MKNIRNILHIQCRFEGCVESVIAEVKCFENFKFLHNTRLKKFFYKLLIYKKSV